MIYEEIFEPIEVICHFKSGKMNPIRFKWNERAYKVKKVNGYWISDEGINRFYHFSVSVEGSDFFELTFDMRGMNWELSRICMEG